MTHPTEKQHFLPRDPAWYGLYLCICVHRPAEEGALYTLILSNLDINTRSNRYQHDDPCLRIRIRSDEKWEKKLERYAHETIRILFEFLKFLKKHFRIWIIGMTMQWLFVGKYVVHGSVDMGTRWLIGLQIIVAQC